MLLLIPAAVTHSRSTPARKTMPQNLVSVNFDILNIVGGIAAIVYLCKEDRLQ